MTDRALVERRWRRSGRNSARSAAASKRARSSETEGACGRGGLPGWRHSSSASAMEASGARRGVVSGPTGGASTSTAVVLQLGLERSREQLTLVVYAEY